MYADDLIIMSLTVAGLQQMLDCCQRSSEQLLLEFNCKKSNCMVIGPASKYKIREMSLGNEYIYWSESFKYLGVNFNSGLKLSVDICSIKRKFYVSCNCILGNTHSLDDMIKLNLMESYCLSILTYATVAMKLSNAQVNELNACWNSVYRRIFDFNKWESVRSFINGLGRLDFYHIRLFMCLKFYSCSLASNNETYKFISKLCYLSEHFMTICFNAGLTMSNYRSFNSISINKMKAVVCSTFALS